jgi:MFS family permease
MQTDKSQKRVWGINWNVLFLGISSLLTDISSEMIFTLVPLFLANILGTTTAIIGFVGGLSDSVDAIFRIFSGWFSDKIKNRKLLTVSGYSFSTLVKPFMYLATSWPMVLGIRFGDRVGKGLRSSPRDALIADSVSVSERGKSFGIHRAMDTAGASLGLALAALIIYLTQGGGIDISLKTYQRLVLIGLIPAVLAVIVLISFVKEAKKATTGKQSTMSLRWLWGFDNRFKIFLALIGIFTLGNSSDFFVILRAQNLDIPLIQTVLMLLLFNIIYMLISLPAGIISDKLGRKWIIILGWVIYGVVYLGFALASHIWQVWILFAVYGIYYGLVEGVGRAFVADLVPVEKRGTAYGLYYGVTGLALLPASVIAGYLWQDIAPSAAFLFGATLAIIAAIGMIFLIRKEPIRS